MTLTICDSIAIAILNQNALIAGVGNELHLHTADKQSAGVQKLSMKLGGKVHGIVPGTKNNLDKLLVYGEKEYLLLQWTEEYAFHLLHRGQLSDWISAAKFLIDVNDFVLLTAHSIVLRLEYLPASKTCRIVQRSSCSDKSTLYCAAVYGQRWSELVCFGGNAFGELLVWQPSDAKVSLLQRISSHNGVIFSINFNAEANMLTTTSDDRSIRFWRVEQCSSEKWANATFSPIASGFGHVARVFQGRIIKCAGQFYAISVGEDSFICVWRYNGELIHKCRQQFGATIWNFEYDETMQILYTVGSTGNVISYNLQDIFEREIKSAASQAPALLPPLSEKAIKDDNNIVDHYVAKIKFVTPDLLVGVTNKNQLVYHKTETADWQLVEDFANSKCTVLEVYTSRLAICGYKRLTLYRFTDVSSEPFEKYYNSNNILNGVIRAFKFLAEDRFLVCDEGGNCLLFHELPTGSLEEHIISLPKCKEPWLTSAALVDAQFLLICNRQGNIFLYQWNETRRNFTQAYTLKHPHGNLGATLIKLVDDAADVAFLKSAGHDGSMKYLKLCKNNATLNVVKREIVPVAWIEALEDLSNADAVELLLGFNDNHFVAWSKFYDFSVQLACGGGHRCWDYCIQRTPANNASIKLAFIKRKQVLLNEFKLFNTFSNPAIRLPPRNTWHVKPCNVMACLEKEVKQQKQGTKIVIVSGGDDNLLKISQYIKAPTSRQQHQLKQLTEVHSHISNIRALKVLKINGAAGSDYLIFSGGGRAQLCATKFNLSSFQVEEMLNVTLKAEAQTEKGNSFNNFSIDPETRIMSLDVLPSMLDDGEADEGYLLFIGCSDGFVRKYRLTKNWQFTLLTEINYGKCILHLRLVDNLLLLIAATDGYIRCSNLEMTRVEVISKHHASGVNALDIRYNRETDELHLLTGGDDQKVVYSKLSLAGRRGSTENLPAVAVLETLNFDNLHTAQVTAVQMSICGRYSYSGGVDQNLFKLDLHTQQVMEEFRTCVADVKGFRLCADEVCLLYGCGLQVCTLKSVDLEVKR